MTNTEKLELYQIDVVYNPKTETKYELQYDHSTICGLLANGVYVASRVDNQPIKQLEELDLTRVGVFILTEVKMK